MMFPHFSQYEFDHAIHNTIPYGAQEEIARRLGKSPGLISQFLSPNDEREGPLFRAAQMLAVLLEIDPDNGRETLDLFNYFVKKACPGDDTLSIDATRERAFRETMEAHLASASDEELDTQAREYDEAAQANHEHAEAIRAEKVRRQKAEISGKILRQFTTNGRR